MKLTPIPLLALASGICLATAACSGSKDNGADTTTSSTTTTDTAATATDTTAPAGTDATAASSHAAQFLTDAIQGDNGEIAFGKKAEDMGSTQGVKDYGKMLVDDHTKAKDQATAVAKALNVPIPDGIKPEKQKMIDMATSMSGKGFDKDFVNDMVDDHKKDIATFQQEANNSSDPAQVTDLAKQTLPTLKKHLETAQSLQKKM